MRKLLLAAALLPFLIAGCGKDTPESIADEVIGIMKQVATAIEGVTDEASAKAAAAKIDALAGQLAPLKQRADKVRATTEGKAAFDAKMKAAEKDMQGMMTKLMNLAMTKPEAAKIISEAMERFGKTAEKLDK